MFWARQIYARPAQQQRNLTEVVSGRSEHIGVTVMTHGARLILISVKADDFKEKLQVDLVCFHERAALWRTASYELARTVAETLANSSIIPQYVYHQPELDSEEPLGFSGTRVPPRCFCFLGYECEVKVKVKVKG